MRKKEIIILTLLVIPVIIIIFSINYFQGNGNHDNETMQCIAEKTKLIVSPTCGACASQKQILGDYVDDFELININQEIMEQYNVDKVPTWIINEQKYVGVKTIEQLKELTGC